MPAPWRIIENMVELRVFPLLFGDFFFFSNLSLSFPFPVFPLASLLPTTTQTLRGAFLPL